MTIFCISHRTINKPVCFTLEKSLNWYFPLAITVNFRSAIKYNIWLHNKASMASILQVCLVNRSNMANGKLNVGNKAGPLVSISEQRNMNCGVRCYTVWLWKAWFNSLGSRENRLRISTNRTCWAPEETLLK